MVTRRALSKVVPVTVACLSLGAPPASGGTSSQQAGKTPRIREVLLAAESDPQAHGALKAYSSTRRFDAIADDVLGALDAVGRMREDLASLH